MIEELLELYKDKFTKNIDFLKNELQGIRTGRANPSLLENISVDVYGSKMPINQLASVSASEAKVLHIQVWDQSVTKNIEAAIRADKNLNFNPVVAGQSIRINLPELTTQRRKEFAKIVSQLSEKSKISLRNLRRELTETIKKSEKNSEISEDEKNVFLSKVDNVVDTHIKNINDICDKKTQDIMTI